MGTLNPELYTIAWLAPLEIEARAAILLLDRRHEGRFDFSPGNDYIYVAGEMCNHNVIIATLPSGQEYGTASAAALASHVKSFFPRLWLGLLVGVAAGLPNLQREPPVDIRLGDVLVGLPEGDTAAVIAYDLGKETTDGFQTLRHGHVLAQTATLIRSAIGNIKLEAPDDADQFLPYYKQLEDKQHQHGSFADPGQENDVLYRVDIQGREWVVPRELRPKPKRTRVWYGPIGSGDKLCKYIHKRNELRDKYNIIGLEMEAAGTMNYIPVGVIRGACDYGDERKNKQWQPYAAAMAAAFAKAVLVRIPPKAVVRVEGQFTDTGAAISIPSRPKRPLDDNSPSSMYRKAKSPRLDDPGAQGSQNLDDDNLPSALLNQGPHAEPRFLDMQQIETLLDSLAFDQIDSRHDNIRQAYEGTCAWMSKTSEYLDWLEPKKLHEHHGFLWFKGNPGAGKSTLMKSTLLNAQKTTKSCFISFFFNARGEDLEKSTIGMHRSLLLQLREKLPQLQIVFNSLGRRARNGNNPQWSLGSLKSLFAQAVQNLEQCPLTCFIDALDECDDSDIRDMISFFEAVGEMAVSKGIVFRVCFSSRYYPHITISKGLTLHLGQQEGHDQDIVSYVKGNLRIGSTKSAELVRSRLIQKASGIFMWVVLVVRILMGEFDKGNLQMLLRKLQSIPAELNDLFRRILLRDDGCQDQLLLCTQWVLFARKPLQQEQLYVALLAGVDTTAKESWDPDEVGEDDMKRLILSSSKGFVELNKSKTNPGVQFIHESVREFFLQEGLIYIWPELQRNFQGLSHERLKNCCLEYMVVSTAGTGLNLEPSVDRLEQEKRRQSAEKTFPLLKYAVGNVFYHADQAAANGINQADFLQSFDLAGWLKLESLIEKHVVRRHSPTVSLLYILAEYNAANLIECHPDKLSGFEVERGNERYGMPILAALATNSRESVYALLKAQAEVEPSTSPLHDLCKQCGQTRVEQKGVGRSFSFTRTKSPFINLVEAGDDRIVTFAVSSTNLARNLIWKATEADFALPKAAVRGYEPTVRLLLDIGVNVNVAGQFGRTALHEAVRRGHEALARLLLENGANPEKQCESGLVPLLIAIHYRGEAMVQLLLDKGANIEAADANGETALHQAAKSARHVSLLIDNGANIEAANTSGQTALHLASEREDIVHVQLLLNKGANTETATNGGQTALHLATQTRNIVIIQLLLNKGANIEAATHYGETALHLATGATVQPLFFSDANIEEAVIYSQKVLYPAHYRGCTALVKLLLEKGASIQANKYGQTALDYARKCDMTDIVSLLMFAGGV